MNQILTEKMSERFLRIINGDVPAIHGFGIINSVSPNASGTGPTMNVDCSTEYEDHFRRGNYGFIQIRGKYGCFVDPFFVMNMDRESVVARVKHGKQPPDPVIYADVETGKGITFNLIEQGRTTAVRKLALHRIAESRVIRTRYVGRKFPIPFFDRAERIQEVDRCEMDVNPAAATATITRTQRFIALLKQTEIVNPDTRQQVKISTALRYKKRSRSYKSAVTHILTAIEKHNTVGLEVLRTNWGNPDRLTYTLQEVHKLNDTRELLQDLVQILTFNKADGLLASTKSTWLHRGMTLQALHKIHATMADLN